MSRRRSLPLLSLAAAGLLALGACGGDEEDVPASGGRDEPTTTTAALTTGAGSGTITVAGTAFAFEAPTCNVGDGDNPKVEVKGSGENGGREFNVAVDRKPSAAGAIETVQVTYSGLEGTVATNLAQDATDSKLEIEDGKVTGTMAFTGGGGAPSGNGTVDITCTPGS